MADDWKIVRKEIENVPCAYKISNSALYAICLGCNAVGFV